MWLGGVSERGARSEGDAPDRKREPWGSLENQVCALIRFAEGRDLAATRILWRKGGSARSRCEGGPETDIRSRSSALCETRGVEGNERLVFPSNPSISTAVSERKMEGRTVKLTILSYVSAMLSAKKGA